MCYKVSFKTYWDGYQRLKEIKQVDDKLKAVYRCPHCHNWHLTKMSYEEYNKK